MQSRKQEEENRRGSKGLFVFLNYLLREEIYLRLSFASFLWSPTRSKRKKKATQTKNLRGFYCYSEHYFCTFVILLIRLLGCLSKAQSTSSSGKVLWTLPPITNPQSCRTFSRASSLLSATTSNTPSKMYRVRTL